MKTSGMDNLDYGIIGNCRSAALVSKEGAIDWCCLPEFDSASVFARILDEEKGGSFEIVVDAEYIITQQYEPNTCILVTRFSSDSGVFEVHDFMPRYQKANGEYHAQPELIRFFKHVSGSPVLQLKYDPKLKYALYDTVTHVKHDFIVSLTDQEEYETVFLYTNLKPEHLTEGDPITLAKDAFCFLSYHEKLEIPTIDKVRLELDRTRVYWLNWMARTPIFEHYSQEVERSAMTLKLMSYEPSGAVLAAVTTSLPETIGEVRNWDYRFCWIRDASMVIKVVSLLGHRKIVKDYLNFIIGLVPDKGEKLQIMYGINGERQLTEHILEHLSGYENSAPVRIGNAAYHQQQNDIYGILMDVIHQQLIQFDEDIDRGEELWAITKSIVWNVSHNWHEPDKGIWEFREEDRNFTFSKVLCWVAIHRARQVALKLGKTHKAAKWKELEAEIKQDILSNAWNEEVLAFTQSYGSKDLDASVLLMESYGFIEARDPKYVSTVKAIEKELCHNGLLYRYKNQDDFGLPSSSFTVCTFWFIQSLYKIGEQAKAEKMFDELLSYSNHLGLFSEDLDFETKRLLGNFPQAYSHLALIETAMLFSGSTL